ncbi:MAG: hypothetical protein J6K32_02420 [Clostridia bacterium]|nr:hypothetical protein [Clostridia bacterium]
MRSPLTDVIRMRRLPASALEGTSSLLPLLADGAGETDCSFTISSLLGSGANCYAYAGTLRDGSGLEQTGLLKEYMPVSLAHRAEDGRSVRFDAAKRHTLEENLSRFLLRNTRLNRMTAASPQTAGVLAQLHSAYASGGTLCLFFPLSRGENYADIEETSLEQLTRHMLSLARAAEVLHESGYVHLDIKPANIVLQQEADALQLIDFDSVVSLPVTEDQAQLLTYSEGYSSPEQITGEIQSIGVPSDLYAIGAVFYNKLFDRKVSYDYPRLPQMLYRKDSSLFRRMRLDTFTQIKRIVVNTQGIIPQLRWRTDAELTGALKRLLALAKRDAQTGLPLYEHLCAAYDLRTASGLNPFYTEKDADYLTGVFADEQYTWRDIAACLQTMTQEMLITQRWEILLYACEALIHLPGSPFTADGEDESTRSLAGICRRQMAELLSSAYNGLGAGSLFRELYAGKGILGERVGLDTQLTNAETLKDDFFFTQALALVDGFEKSYTHICDTADDPALLEYAHNAAMSLLGKQGELLAYMRRYPEAMERMLLACEHAAQLSVAGVQLLRLRTNILRCAVLCADEEWLDAVLRGWLASLRAVTGVAGGMDTPEEIAQLLRALIALPDGHRDYQKGHLIHTVLFLLRHRRREDAAPALSEIAAWYDRSDGSFLRHPGELILSCAVVLEAARGNEQRVRLYAYALREFPPARGSFVESVICLGAVMEAKLLLGGDARLEREEIRLHVLAELRLHTGEHEQAVREWFAPFLDGGSDEACLSCLTFMYR